MKIKKKPRNESKAERFKRVAEARVNKLIAMLRLLGNCSTPSTYEFTDTQIEYIFSALQAELDKARKCFICRSKRGKKRFTLLSNPEYEPEVVLDPKIVLALPDGTYLRAVSLADSEYPAIKIYWDRNNPDDEGEICFAEHHVNKTGANLFIGVYAPK